MAYRSWRVCHNYSKRFVQIHHQCRFASPLASMMHSKTMEGIPHAEDIHVDTTSYKFQPCLTLSSFTLHLSTALCLPRLTICVARYILLPIQNRCLASWRYFERTGGHIEASPGPLIKAGCTTLRGDSGEKFLMRSRHLICHWCGSSWWMLFVCSID